MNDRPRRIQKKEIAFEVGVHPGTLSMMIHEGLTLPCWPCTLAECVAAVRAFRERMNSDEEKRSPMKSDEA